MPAPLYQGRVRFQAGTGAATVTLPSGSVLLRIRARTTTTGANATMTIFAGIYADAGNSTFTVNGNDTSPTQLDFDHTSFLSQNDTTVAGSSDIVFTGANMGQWYVEYALPASGAAH
jgi:hypothetical protein